MKRIIFYTILAASVIASSCVLLFVGNGYNILDFTVKSLFNGTFIDMYNLFGLNYFIYICGFAVFIVLNAALVLTMLLIFLFTGFKLNKIAKFYRICIWWFVSTIIFTAVYIWYITKGFTAFAFDFATQWQSLLPLVTSIIVLIFAIIFRKIEKRNRF